METTRNADDATWTKIRAGFYTATVNGKELTVENMREQTGRNEWAIEVDGSVDDFSRTMAGAKSAAVAAALYC